MAGESGGGSASFSTSFGDISTGLFGTDASGTTTGTGLQTIDRTLTEGLEIDEEGLLRLIDEALSGVGGLAEIFGLEAGAGLFGGSVATQQTTDLLAAIAGGVLSHAFLREKIGSKNFRIVSIDAVVLLLIAAVVLLVAAFCSLLLLLIF